VSTHSNEHEVIQAVLDAKVHDVVLTGYNFRKTNLAPLDAAIAEAVKAGLGIVAMKTMAGGFWDRGRPQMGFEQSQYHDGDPRLYVVRPS